MRPAATGSLSLSAAETSLEHGAGPAAGQNVSCAGADASGDLECATASATDGPPLPYPVRRWGGEITYDAADGYPVLFGNNNQTWAFEDSHWVNLEPKVDPPSTNFACLTYDWADGYVLLFGGGRGGIGTPILDRSTTWTYRAGVWTNITDPADSPPGLQYPSCAYDAAPGDGYVVLFGGVDAEGPTYTGHSYLTLHSSDQTWEFQDGRWTNVTDLGTPHPSARFGASMVYDSSDGYLLLYGGAINGTSTANGSCSPAQCPHLSDTWTFHDGIWSNITAAASVHGTPPGRWEAGIANDSADGYVIIFGGQANGYKSYNATGNYTWAFSGGVWRNLTISLRLSPTTRFGEAMGYDPATASVLMFSGLNSTSAAHLTPDTWSFQNGTWQNLSYVLTAHETGLPSTTAWSVTVVPGVGAPVKSAHRGTTLSFGWATGSYDYTVAPVAGYYLSSGSVAGTVDPGAPTVSVEFAKDSLKVRFNESGLDRSWKISWSVTLGAKAESTTGGAITFSGLAPGTYPYEIGAVSNYSLNRSFTGSVTIVANGASGYAGEIGLRFHLVTYRVTFEETGLPTGTHWTVTFNGVTKSGSSQRISFSISNGTYTFVDSAPDDVGDPSSGQIAVSGTAVTVPITFSGEGGSIAISGPAVASDR